MVNALTFSAARGAAVISVALLAGRCAPASAQPPWNAMAYGAMPVPVLNPYVSALGVQGYGRPQEMPPRGSLARLVKNPNASHGLPPFALTDQTGSIQRYVEPVPGIDLDSHIDQVVMVRHDTGQTLLASQLELPPKPLYPLLGGPSNGISPHTSESIESISARAGADRTIQPAQFLDDDDSTVQLLPQEEELPDGTPSRGDRSTSQGAAARDESMLGEVDYLGSPDELASEPLLHEPMYGDKPVEPCPKCGGFHFSHECEGRRWHGGRPSRPGIHHGGLRPEICRWFADVELNFIRTHVTDGAFGKLSEKYELSPRVIVGFDQTGILDGRVRYWHYGQDTRVLGGGLVDVEFDVLDIEAMHRFRGQSFEGLLGGGLRLAGIELTDDGAAAGADLMGMTFFLEGCMPLWSLHEGQFRWVFGGRLSILGGDWGGEPDNAFVGELIQDDNMIVHELHTGLDYAVCYRDFDLHARLGFEMQNWHSDALSQNGAHSIGFIGPGVQIGAGF